MPTGRDEMNLVQYPFALLSSRNSHKKGEPEQKTIELKWQDKNKGKVVEKSWLVTGSDRWGLPTEDAERLYVALMAITKENGFQEQTVNFRTLQIFEILQWPKRSGSSYQRLRKALQTLKGINIYATNVFWDNKLKKCHPMRSFSIINNYDEYGDKNKTISITWNNVLWASFQANYIKALNTQLYFKLESSITRRLYRFLDKHFYYKHKYQIELLQLAFRHLGMSQKYYPSDIKRKLTPACQELVDQGWLKNFEYQKEARVEVVVFQKNNVPLLTTEPFKHPEELVQTLVEQGITKTVAQRLYDKYTSRIKRQIEYFEFERDNYPHLIVKNPGGYLRRRIEEDWAPHAKYISTEEQGRRAKKQAEQQRRLEYQFKVEQWENWQKQTPEEKVKGEMWLWARNFQKKHQRTPTSSERESQQAELITAIPTDEEEYQEIFGKSLKTTKKFNF